MTKKRLRIITDRVVKARAYEDVYEDVYALIHDIFSPLTD
jgi:hypothetical protein